MKAFNILLETARKVYGFLNETKAGAVIMLVFTLAPLFHGYYDTAVNPMDFSVSSAVEQAVDDYSNYEDIRQQEQREEQDIIAWTLAQITIC